MTVTRSQLGHLGGNPRFLPPREDAANQIGHGQKPTTDFVAMWWAWLVALSFTSPEL